MLNFYLVPSNVWFHLDHGSALELVNFSEGYKIFVKDFVVLDFMGSMGFMPNGVGFVYSTLDDILVCDNDVVRCEYELSMLGEGYGDVCTVTGFVSELDLSGFIYSDVMVIGGTVSRCLVPLEMALYFGGRRSFGDYNKGFMARDGCGDIIFDLTLLDACSDVDLSSFLKGCCVRRYLNCYGRKFLEVFLSDYVYSGWLEHWIGDEVSFVSRVLFLNKDFLGDVLDIISQGDSMGEYLEWLCLICVGMM